MLIKFDPNHELSRNYPMNYVILGLSTLFQAYELSYLCALTDPVIVFETAFLTLALTIGLTVYAMTSKEDVF